jgi:hypothetical protein
MDGWTEQPGKNCRLKAGWEGTNLTTQFFKKVNNLIILLTL